MKTIKKLLPVLLGFFISIAVLFSTNAEAAGYSATYATFASARLSSASTVVYNATLTGVPQSDDGMIYLYALQPFEYVVSPTDFQVSVCAASASPAFSFNLKSSAGVSMICYKFAMAVKVNGQLVTLANSCQYITNPEVAATNTRAPQNIGFVEPYEKMLLYRVGEVAPVMWKYNSPATAVIVNKADPDLVNPLALRKDSHPQKKMYYMFNAATVTGVAKLQSTMSNFAANSTVDEFIIGNEVNTRTWNYTAYVNAETYVREYYQAFRVSYNAIKSTNANAKVFISLDQNWDRNRNDPEYIDGADFMLLFNQMMVAEGNIDWGLAMHPYPTPLTYAKFWDYSGCPSGSYYVNQVNSGKIVTFQNLPIMTSFMSMPGMLSPTGKIRDIILPEMGITSAQGYEVQAATIMAVYQACRNNPAIKRIYYHRMNEGGQLNFGTVGISEEVYQAVLHGNPGKYDQWAKNFIGIADWHQVLNY